MQTEGAEEERRGGEYATQREWKTKHLLFSLFCSSLHRAAYISHSPVKAKRHQLLGGYLLASQYDIKTLTFLIQHEHHLTGKYEEYWLEEESAGSDPISSSWPHKRHKAASIRLQHDR